MLAVGPAELVVIAVIVVITLVTPLAVCFLLYRWARSVAEKRNSDVYRRLRWLPVAGAVFWIASPLAMVTWLPRTFMSVEALPPEEKASFLAEGIAESMNVSVLLGAIAMLCVAGSVLASAIGTRSK